MQSFSYTARDLSTQETVKSDVEAENEQAAAKLLIKQNLFPIDIKVKSAKSASLPFIGGVRSKDRVIFTRQLSSLINAGLPLVQSLHTVKDQINNKALLEIIDKIVVDVESGMSLSKAFAQHPKVFNQIYVSLVAAGEASGSLDKSLERLADQQEKDAAIASKIRGALVYPIVVLVVIIAVVIFMLTTLLPQVASLYHDLHKTLPIMTRLLVSLANFVNHFWWLVVILVGVAGYGLYNWIRSAPGRYTYDQFKMQLPIFGTLFQKVYMARFSRTMATLMSSGIPVLQSMDIVSKAVNNVVVEAAIQRALVKVKAGRALSESLSVEPSFSSLVPQMAKIGEESGSIDDMLAKVAVYYENEVDEAVKNLSTIMEPVLMVILGIVVGAVIVAVLLPVYSLVGGGINLG